MPIPFIVPFLLGLGKAGATAGTAASGVVVAAKGAALASAGVKATAVGALMVVKGVTMTKAAGLTILAVTTVASGALGTTTEVLEKSGYRTDTADERRAVHGEIEQAIHKRGRHVVRYCDKPGGGRQLVPRTYRFCPADGSAPKTGEVFDYAKVK